MKKKKKTKELSIYISRGTCCAIAKKKVNPIYKKRIFEIRLHMIYESLSKNNGFVLFFGYKSLLIQYQTQNDIQNIHNINKTPTIQS